MRLKIGEFLLLSVGQEQWGHGEAMGDLWGERPTCSRAAGHGGGKALGRFLGSLVLKRAVPSPTRLIRGSFQECVFFCVREEPVLFLRVEGDFVAYTPRGKDSLHENLHGLRRGPRGEDLELTIRKEVMAAGPWQGPPCSDAHLHVVWCPTEQRLEDPRWRRPLLGVPRWGWVLTAIPVSSRSTTSRS